MRKRLAFFAAVFAAAFVGSAQSQLKLHMQAERAVSHKQVSVFTRSPEIVSVGGGAFIDGTFLVGVFESVLSKNNVNSIFMMT